MDEALDRILASRERQLLATTLPALLEKRFRQLLAAHQRALVDRQASQAIARGPANAGPLNSHMLVLRSLLSMRDLSSDYLCCFVSYADTLLRLEQASGAKAAAGENGGRMRRARGDWR